ncbi:hypothetical protein ACFL1U_03300 [Patescibacteria group bacterium]
MKKATLAQGNEIINLILQKEVSSAKVQSLLETGIFSDLLDVEDLRKVDRYALRQLLNKVAGTTQIVDGVTITSLETIILPAQNVSLHERIDGKYNSIADVFTEPERFPITFGNTGRTLVLAHFNREIEKRDCSFWANKNGYEQAQIEDLLAVGSHPEYQDLQRRFSIICFGSDCGVNGIVHYPILTAWKKNKRVLTVASTWPKPWGKNDRVLVVRKEAA